MSAKHGCSKYSVPDIEMLDMMRKPYKNQLIEAALQASVLAKKRTFDSLDGNS